MRAIEERVQNNIVLLQNKSEVNEDGRTTVLTAQFFIHDKKRWAMQKISWIHWNQNAAEACSLRTDVCC